eukprot:303248-Rhodomonas_salina.1
MTHARVIGYRMLAYWQSPTRAFPIPNAVAKEHMACLRTAHTVADCAHADAGTGLGVASA